MRAMNVIISVMCLGAGCAMLAQGAVVAGPTLTRGTSTKTALPAGPQESSVVMPPLGGEYQVLETPSIFSSDRRLRVPTVGIGSTSSGGPRPPGGGTSQPPSVSRVFRASLVDDTGPLALVEVSDASGSRNYYLRQGERIPDTSLVISQITSDALAVGAPGTTRRLVPIGFTLEGDHKDALPSASAAGTPAVVSARTGRSPNTVPGGTRMTPRTGITPAASTPALSPEAVDAALQRMMQRRQIETGGVN